MIFPQLFKFPSEEMVEGFDNLTTETPLGTVKVLIKFDHNAISTKLPIKKILKYRNASLFVLEGTDLYLEIIKVPISPKIPKHMGVEDCIAYLIRFKCLKKLQPEFVCALDFAEDNLDAHPESGERLMSQSFEHENIRLSIGTEDEESFQARAKHQLWMPHRLFTEDLISYENVECTKNGIKIILPLFLEGEVGQIQFVVSWTQVKKHDPISTWFAVDTSSEEILKQICT